MMAPSPGFSHIFENDHGDEYIIVSERVIFFEVPLLHYYRIASLLFEPKEVTQSTFVH